MTAESTIIWQAIKIVELEKELEETKYRLRYHQAQNQEPVEKREYWDCECGNRSRGKIRCGKCFFPKK